jgi:hypothetical protein
VDSVSVRQTAAARVRTAEHGKIPGHPDLWINTKWTHARSTRPFILVVSAKQGQKDPGRTSKGLHPGRTSPSRAKVTPPSNKRGKALA